MPEANDFQTIVRAVYAVDDAIRAENNFTELRAPKFGDHAATLGESPQGKRCIEQLTSHPLGGRNIIERYVGNDPLQIAQGVGGEEDFEVHWGMRLRASSSEMRSPRSSEANPSSTA
jgi:hypothetical protein